jgi:hypothetical protein
VPQWNCPRATINKKRGRKNLLDDNELRLCAGGVLETVCWVKVQKKNRITNAHYFRSPHLHKTDVIIRQILRPQTLKVEPKTCPTVLQIAFTLSTSNVFYKYNSLIISCLSQF